MKLKTFIEKGLRLNYSLDSDDDLLSDKELIAEIQTQLSYGGYVLDIDGLFGRITRESLNLFKERNYLGQPDVLGKTTAEKLLEYTPSNSFAVVFPPIQYDTRKFICSIPIGHIQKALSSENYKDIAKEYGINEAALRAVVEVESAGSGFLLNEKAPARPKILFEAHWFGKFTNYAFNRLHPSISQSRWNRGLYKGGSGEWDRFFMAASLDFESAMKSISIGLGQVMGFNHKIVDDNDEFFKRMGHNYTLYGYNNVRELCAEAHVDELHQLVQMMNFIKNSNLVDELRRMDWAGFAYRYNGEGYKANQYDVKLANAYRKWSKLV